MHATEGYFDELIPAPDGSGSDAGFTPVACPPEPFRLMRHWAPMIESPDALLACATAISMQRNPGVSLAKLDRTLNGIANEIRKTVRGPQQQALLAHLHHHLFDTMLFAGDGRDYYNPANSDIAEVVKRRTGLPILLSLVYKDIAGRLGLRVDGIGLPGHFVVSVATDEGPMLVDPFFGGVVLSEEEAAERVRSILGPEETVTTNMLRPVSNRHWITRILQNLLGSYGAASRYNDVAAILELEMLLWPEQKHLQRDLGLCLARVGLPSEAGRWLDVYLKGNPNDPQRGDLEELLAVLR
ncbi:MAG: transglutaminase-like domain-containing protein [Planctomycetota bacterium]